MKVRPQGATEEASAASRPWHSLSAEECLHALSVTPLGLAAQEAVRRLETLGPNALPQPPVPRAWQRLARQFNNLLLLVLLAASVVTALIGHWVDSVVIAAVVIVNVLIGYVQEGKAERSLQAIRHLLAPRALVLRDGHTREIDAAELVPGDIVLLASGDGVPADLRLLEARNLRVDESVLTGESVPVEKQLQAVPVDAVAGDRSCMVHAGTLVTQGQARALVVATAAHTEVGRIGRLIETVDTGTTPLLRRMATFNRILTLAIIGVAGLLFAFGTLVRKLPAGEMFMAAVGLAVAAIPEGLPAILTIALAIGVQRMAARHAVIRRLPAVEALGSVTVICSDKTGTLTRNEMTVQELVLSGGRRLTVGGVGYAPQGDLSLEGVVVDPTADAALADILRALSEIAALCNDANLHQTQDGWQLAGDPTEGALLTLAMKAGLDPPELRQRWPRLDAVPFESEHRYMATLHAQGEGSIALVKGAPERILAMCALQLGSAGGDEPLDAAYWSAQVEAQARAGRRVLALARRHLPAGRTDFGPADVEQGLTLLCVVGIIDPPREEAVRAVVRCRAAGIRVVMITGDHGATASAIAAQLNLGAELQAITGAQIDAMDETTLREAVAKTCVFARASPEHKLRLVRALQARGEVVAMTGDGVNDAPALKQADVGVAMGRKGTEAAKQAAAIVLADDNFASIAHAVEEGRTVYDNLRKTVAFMLPVNGGESLSLLLAVLLGLTLPIAPAQILWVNMVSSVALALVLAFEPAEPDVMRRPPRAPDEPLLSHFVLWRILFVSALFTTGIFGMYEWTLQGGASIEAARTAAVNTLVCMEVFYLFSVRYLKSPSFTVQGVRGTPRVLAAVAAVFVLQLLFTYLPALQATFGTRALPFETGLHIVLAGVLLLLLLELEKALLRRLGLAPGAEAVATEPY